MVKDSCPGRGGIAPMQQALDMYHMLPAAELAIVPNATHMSTLTPLCMQIVLDFLLRCNLQA